tara:strand:- start:83 stop:424 length:342 start_codon:yes stop_codon:yes gene_type:complete
MKTLSYITGNISFDNASQIAVPANASAQLTIWHDEEVVYQRDLSIDPSSLNVFKYDTFEVKDFEYEPGQEYLLRIQICIDPKTGPQKGDYITRAPALVRAAVENLDIQLSQMK